jgi:hypothetical protein
MPWGIEVYMQAQDAQGYAKSWQNQNCLLEAIVQIHLSSHHTGTVLVHTTRRIRHVVAGCHEQIVDDALASFSSCFRC